MRRRRRTDLTGELEQAERLTELDRPVEALRILDGAVRRARASGSPHLARARLAEATALLALERFADAVTAATEACGLAPDQPDACFELGTAAYHCGRFETAVEAYQRCVALDPHDADAWHRLGRARLWSGDERGAGTALARAAALDGSSYVVPVRIAAAEFDRLAAAVWGAIPAPFQARLANTLVAVEPLPALDEVEDGLDPDVLGVYTGATVLQEGSWMERIVLYQRNHETVCAGLGALREEIRRTILHEVGHHFGMEHGELPY